MEKSFIHLFQDELQDILSAENQIVEALSEVINAADSSEFKEALKSHLQETNAQIDRLYKIFNILNLESKEKFCKGAMGLIDECKEVLKVAPSKSPLRDAALISKIQRIEHYEIAAYGTLVSFAKEMNQDEVVALLGETLAEEEGADEKLTSIAEGGLLKSGVNHQANISNK